MNINEQEEPIFPYLPVAIDALIKILERNNGKLPLLIALHILYLADRAHMLASGGRSSEIGDLFVKTGERTAAHKSLLGLSNNRCPYPEAQTIWDKYFFTENDYLNLRIPYPDRSPIVDYFHPTRYCLFDYLSDVISNYNEYPLPEITTTANIGDEIKVIDLFKWHMSDIPKKRLYELASLAVRDLHDCFISEHHYEGSPYISET